MKMLQTAPIFQNGMIVQRDKPVVLWGKGKPGAKISAELQKSTGEAVVDANGQWQIILPPVNASDDETLIIRSEDELLTFSGVAVGEVWLAGGQSNMEFHMRYEKHRFEEMELPENPRLRFYDVPEVCFDGQLEAFDYSRMGIWREANSKDLEYFSAVGYYFQKELESCLDVPVGIIGCNWGGTTASAWMNADTVARVGQPWMEEYKERVAGMDMDAYWKRQLANPMSGRGNPFADPFGEAVLPRTLTPEEIQALMGKMTAKLTDFQDYFDEMQPQTIPGCLYEHMLKTVAPFGIRGFLWYQGESDDVSGRQSIYKDMLTALIGDWRSLWKDESLPFILVQLPGWDHWLDIENLDYTTIRRCQELVTDTVDNTWLCSISDAGEEADIHPKNKKVVGHRLALLARGHVYGEDILCDAPAVENVHRSGSQVIISFKNASGGLKIGQGDSVAALKVFSLDEPIEFAVRVDKDQLIIDLEGENQGPLRIEFAQECWYLVNLYNSSDIPAIPFMVRC